MYLIKSTILAIGNLVTHWEYLLQLNADVFHLFTIIFHWLSDEEEEEEDNRSLFFAENLCSLISSEALLCLQLYPPKGSWSGWSHFHSFSNWTSTLATRWFAHIYTQWFWVSTPASPSRLAAAFFLFSTSCRLVAAHWSCHSKQISSKTSQI